ncbi:hypothetical protein IDJ77_10200 [Mucilaginibacter sp. ZT4R22]|uniref:Outer membrane protein beta-barrel domain-containing protein n=1 Tax=Mucilaginibacter pankratovii TaxID=2772110 RepID=A0ABR7WPF1_9SPHI|nr:hypothetical protein [Mucilaginibacter pankratovii]MBD1364180.1 hypothetical protein [Mucilaginibacter pankratovii]
MKKVLLAILLTGASAATCLAQKSGAGKFSIGLELGTPTGDISNFYNLAVGGSVKYDVPIETGTTFNVSLGYTSLQGKHNFGSTGFVPLKAGLKHYFDKGFYGEGQLGAAFSTEDNGGTFFAYSPGIGYTFAGGFDIGVRYEAWSKNGTIGQFATRLAFNF